MVAATYTTQLQAGLGMLDETRELLGIKVEKKPPEGAPPGDGDGGDPDGDLSIPKNNPMIPQPV